MKLKGFGAVLAALALVALSAVSVFATDYSSVITSNTGSLLTDLAPAIAVAVGVGIAIWVAFFSASAIFTALRVAKKGKGGA